MPWGMHIHLRNGHKLLFQAAVCLVSGALGLWMAVYWVLHVHVIGQHVRVGARDTRDGFKEGSCELDSKPL